MKKVMLMVMLVTVSGITFGQKPGHGHHHGDGDPVEHMSEFLDLTDAQKESIRSIHAEYKDKMKAAKESDDHELIETLHSEKKEKIEAVLTDEQKVKFKEHHEQMREEHQAKRKEMQKMMHEKMAPVMKAKRVAFENELSADEKATIERVREMAQSQMNDSMPKGQHGPPAWVTEAKTQLQPIIDAHKTSLDSIMADLHSEHKEMMKENHKHMEKGDHPKHKQGDRRKNKMEDGRRKGMKDGMLVRFLLMDPNATEE